jgi:hypothetical protein
VWLRVVRVCSNSRTGLLEADWEVKALLKPRHSEWYNRFFVVCWRLDAGAHPCWSTFAAAQLSLSTPPACPSLVQDLGRLRQLAAVRGLVSSELRARLWPVLAGGTDAPSLPQSSPAGHASTPRRSSELGRAIPALSPAAVEPPSPRAGTSLGSEYAEWASGTHKDTGTVSCQAGT